MQMKAAIYVRTSTTEQHPENQIQDCVKFAEKKGYQVEGVYVEKLSAYKQILRPEYEKVKEKARTGQIQAVIVWARDRWVRNRAALMPDVTYLRNYGC